MDPCRIEVKRSSFPKDFIFGGATSAYQVEGAWNVGGKGWNNWDYMTEHDPGSIADRSNGKRAIDHYNMFKEDVALMKKVGLDSYRFSISWSRILPGGRLCDGICKEGIQFYNDLIDALLDGGIEPCATIFHWDVPQRLECDYRGFLNHQIVEYFCEFAEICFWEFGDRVKYWVTLNEPRSFAYCGYVIARFPPRRGRPLATTDERLFRCRVLQHRSEFKMPPRTSSRRHMVREPVALAYNSQSAASSGRDLFREQVDIHDTSDERDPITELVDMARNLPYDTSPELDAVRELVAEAYNSPYRTSSEGDAVREPVAQAYNMPYRTSSEGRAVRGPVAQANNMRYRTSSEGRAVREPVAQAYNSRHIKSSEGDPGTEPYIVAHNLILAHAHAVNIYRKYYQKHQQGKIGMTNVSVWFYPLDENNPEDVEAAWRAIDFYLGWFVAPVITGDYPPSMRNNVRKRLPKFKPDEVALVKGSCDFLGINYYTAHYAKNVPREPSITHYDNDQHVEDHTNRGNTPIGKRGGSIWLYIVPEGIYNMMLYIKERYNNPEIIITENGVDELKDDNLTVSQACKDETRVQYFKDHLAYLKKAMDSGVRLKGYFIWSLFDNFEWTQGYNVRFGVYHVDFMNEKLNRSSKRSAEWWMGFLNKKTKEAKGCQA